MYINLYYSQYTLLDPSSIPVFEFSCLEVQSLVLLVETLVYLHLEPTLGDFAAISFILSYPSHSGIPLAHVARKRQPTILHNYFLFLEQYPTIQIYGLDDYGIPFRSYSLRLVLLATRPILLAIHSIRLVLLTARIAFVYYASPLVPLCLQQDHLRFSCCIYSEPFIIGSLAIDAAPFVQLDHLNP